MMKVTKFLGNKEVKVCDIPEPQIGKADDVKIKIHYCGICGSDVGAYAFPPLIVPSKLTKGEPPYIQGHEFTGEVVEIGAGVTKFKVGDRVTAEPVMYCGKCEQCLTGHHNICEDVSCIGYSADGAFANYIVWDEEKIYALPDNIDDKVGALIEPTGVAYGAVVDSGLKFNETCIVFGAGAIGIMAMQTANLMGAKMTIVIDIEQSRLELAKKMGATHIINAKEKNVVEEVMKLCPKGVDVAIEAAGANVTFNTAIYCLKKHGILQIVAMFHNPITIENQPAFMSKNLTLKMSSAAYQDRWEDLIDHISKGKLKPQMLISKEIILDNLIEEGIEPLMNDKSLYKILVKCD